MHFDARTSKRALRPKASRRARRQQSGIFNDPPPDPPQQDAIPTTQPPTDKPKKTLAQVHAAFILEYKQGVNRLCIESGKPKKFNDM